MSWILSSTPESPQQYRHFFPTVHFIPKVPNSILWRAGVFAETFARLHKWGVRAEVLYPAVSIPSDAALQSASDSWRAALPPDLVAFLEGATVFLSINRFERKKVLALVLRVMTEFRSQKALEKNNSVFQTIIVLNNSFFRI